MKRLACLCLLLFSVVAHAGGPRWIAGAQWANAGKPMTWYRNSVTYAVDAGPLSTYVDHAAAARLVDAAAAPWNLPALPFKLVNGGALAEDVNADNVYLGQNGLVWPSDVARDNYTATQIAVVLDADGSITDALLGAGASAASNCRTNAVTESVDLFLQPGNIAHAIVVLNGRCSGPAPEQQLQLQYQLLRVFGRVIGLGWSQLNDNVYTGTPAPTYPQQLHWPIMHPLDVLCGPYTYQCLPAPFTLRDDDISAMWQMYADATTSYTSANMVLVRGYLSFPNHAPMPGVNIVARRYSRWTGYQLDAFQDVSAVSGYPLALSRGNPVTGPQTDPLGVSGYDTPSPYGWYAMGGVNLGPGSELVFTSEAVNPLYTGPYAVGPYHMGTPAPSGSPMNVNMGTFSAGSYYQFAPVVNDAAADCAAGADGQESAPAQLPADGTWNGRLCGVGHTSWFTLPVKSGHTAAFEVVATDETGAATSTKAMPLIGLWHGTDSAGTLPTLAAAGVAFNTSHIGMTQLAAGFAATESLRIAVADARGDGRPDYTYRLRVLYADTASPSRITSAGGTVAITGTGFTPACSVTVGGVAARVVSQSSTRLLILAPPASALRTGGANDIVIVDRSTGGTSSISGGLIYGAATSDALTITAQPASSVAVGAMSTFALQLTGGQGAPVRNGEVTVSAGGGSVVLGACNLSSCTLVTDSNGMAQTSVTALAAGPMLLRAVSSGGSTVQASYTATAVARSVSLLRPVQYLASGSGVLFSPAAVAVAGGSGAAGQTLTWTWSSPRITAAATSVTSSSGSASIAATAALRDGETATVQACAWGTVCAQGTLNAVASADLRIVAVSGDVQNLSAGDTLAAVAFRVVDPSGHPVAGASVELYQLVTGWQPPCPASGRCPAAPVYGKAVTASISDDDGLVTVTPLAYANTAATTKITATVGSQGAVNVTLQKSP